MSQVQREHTIEVGEKKKDVGLRRLSNSASSLPGQEVLSEAEEVDEEDIGSDGKEDGEEG
jgi:hypothetical protein